MDRAIEGDNPAKKYVKGLDPEQLIDFTIGGEQYIETTHKDKKILLSTSQKRCSDTK